MMTTMPPIVCLCGSTRFSQAFQDANLRETLAGKIVLSIGCDMRSDAEIFGHLSEEELVAIKTKLDELHLRKIDLSNEILVLNVAGYIGESTAREITYAIEHHKVVRYLESPPVRADETTDPADGMVTFTRELLYDETGQEAGHQIAVTPEYQAFLEIGR